MPLNAAAGANCDSAAILKRNHHDAILNRVLGGARVHREVIGGLMRSVAAVHLTIIVHALPRC